jgi:hypothetical protein
MSSGQDESEVQRLQQEVHAAILAGRLEEARATLAELIARQQASADTDAVSATLEASTSPPPSATTESVECTAPSHPWTTMGKQWRWVLLGAVVGLLVIGRFWHRSRSGARRPRARGRRW